MPRTRLRNLLGAILVTALLVRVAAIAVIGPNALRFGDAQDYLDTCASLCSDGRYPDRGSLPFLRAPGLPFFLAAATLCHPERVVVAKLALALCDVATTGLVLLLTLLLFGEGAWRAALLAAALAAIDPFLTLASSDVTTEPLATLLLTASLCALLRARRPGYAFAIAWAGGVAMGLAALTRPGSLAIAPAWFLLPLFARKDARAPSRPADDVTRDRDARRTPRLVLVLACVLGTASALAPWSLRNWLHFGEPILVNDAGGYNAWRGTHPRLHDMLARSGDPRRFAEESLALEQELDHLARDEGLGEEESPRARERRWWSATMARLRADPAGGARILARNALAFFRPWLDPAARGLLAVAASAAWFVSLGVFALVGLFVLWRDHRPVAALLVAGVGLAGLAHVPFQTVLRFRLPFTEPLLLALAAAGAMACRDALLPRRRASIAGATGHVGSGPGERTRRADG